MAFVSPAPGLVDCRHANAIDPCRPATASRRRLSKVAVAMAVKKTYSSFSEIIGGDDRPTLVDFYSFGCGPCRMIAPELGEVGRRVGDKMGVVKLDSDKHASIASKYSVAALPTLVLFRGGKELGRWVGYRDANQIMQDVGPFIG